MDCSDARIRDSDEDGGDQRAVDFLQNQLAGDCMRMHQDFMSDIGSSLQLTTVQLVMEY